MPKLKFSKEYLQRATKPIPKKDSAKKDQTTAEVQSQPRHATGFLQYCGTCDRNQLLKVDTLGSKTCNVCHSPAPDRSHSPICDSNWHGQLLSGRWREAEFSR